MGSRGHHAVASAGRSVARQSPPQEHATSSRDHSSQTKGTAGFLLQLQGANGNRYVQRLIRAAGQVRALSPIRPRLHRQGDACTREHEPDRAIHAAQPEPAVPRADGAPVDEEAMDRRSLDSVEARLTSSKGGGQPLPDDIRTSMESAIGADFSAVKVHADDGAGQMSRDLGARAFTHGTDIYFGANTYRPQTTSGRRLLAHELAHVVQQSGGTGPPHDHAHQTTERITDRSDRRAVQRVPNVTAVNAPAEMPAGQGSRVTLTATAPRGTAIAWGFVGGGNGAAFGAGTGRTNTLTAPAGSTGGVITVQAADAANAADVATANITLVEVQQPTFAFAPAMPAFAPANTMDASVCGNTATAAAVTVPARPPVIWSIVGNRRGATINPATGVIVPSATETGNIRIRATDSVLAAARNEQTLTIQAHPTGITRTSILTFPLPAASGGPYGAIYTHTFASSGGNIANVMVTEQVFSGNNPFLFGGLPVLPGALNAPAGALQDLIGSPAGVINVNNFLPSPPNPGLPQLFDTPQILYWRSDQCSPAPAAPPAAGPADHWVPFVNVPIKANLFARRGNFFFQTSDNGVSTAPEPYIGPALAAGPPPVGSVCPAGESLSNITFSPASIAADASPLTTTAGTVVVRPGGSLVTWSFPGPTFGATIVAQGNPALFGAGNIAGRVRARAALTATPACFAEGWLRMEEVEIGPAIRFRPASVRAGATTRATVPTKPGARVVLWSIQGPALGAVIARNPDNSATVTAGAQVGRITIRATDQRDATRFTEASLVIN